MAAMTIAGNNNNSLPYPRTLKDAKALHHQQANALRLRADNAERERKFLLLEHDNGRMKEERHWRQAEIDHRREQDRLATAKQANKSTSATDTRKGAIPKRRVMTKEANGQSGVICANSNSTDVAQPVSSAHLAVAMSNTKDDVWRTHT